MKIWPKKGSKLTAAFFAKYLANGLSPNAHLPRQNPHVAIQLSVLTVMDERAWCSQLSASFSLELCRYPIGALVIVAATEAATKIVFGLLKMQLPMMEQNMKVVADSENASSGIDPGSNSPMLSQML